MTEFILTPVTAQLSAKTILDLNSIREQMRIAKYLSSRFPGSTFLDRMAKNVSANLVGTKYNRIPKAEKGIML